MRFTFAALALAASTVSASVIARQSIPTCADACLFGSDVNYDGCGSTDNICLCKSQTFVSTSTACIEAACSGSDLQTALEVSQEICASVGVTLTSSAPASTEASSSTADVPASSTASSGASKSTATSPASSASSSASSTSSSAAAAATTSNAAVSNSVNALAGLAAIGLAALAL